MAVNLGSAVGTIEIKTKANGFKEAKNMLDNLDSEAKTLSTGISGLSSAFDTVGNNIQSGMTSKLKSAGEEFRSTQQNFNSGLQSMSTSSTKTSGDINSLTDKIGLMGNNTRDVSEAVSYGLANQRTHVDYLTRSMILAEKETSEFNQESKETKESVNDAGNEFEQAGRKSKKYGDDLYSSGKKGSLGIKEIVTALGLVKIAGAAFNQIRDSMDAAFSRLDIFSNFSKVMGTYTGSAEKAANALGKVDDAVTGTAYSLDVAAQATQNLTTAGMDIDVAADQIGIWGDAVAFYSDGTSESLKQTTDALSKMVSRGKVNMGQLSRIVTENGIPAVKMYAELTGKSADEVQTALSRGEISAEDFINGVSTAMKDGTKSFTSIEGAAKDAEGLYSTTFANIKTAVTRGVAGIITAADKGMKKANLGSIQENAMKTKDMINELFGTAQKHLPPIIGFFGGIVSVVSQLTPAIPPLVAAFLAFKGATVGVAMLETGILNLRVAFMNMVETMVANPWAAAAAGLAIVAVSAYKLYKEFNKVKDAYDETAEARQSSFADVEAEADNLDNLGQRLEELDGIEGKSASQKAEMKEIVKELNQQVEGLGLQYDEEKDKLSKNTDEIYKAIEARKKKMIADAAAEKQSEIAKDMFEANVALEEQQQKVEELQTKWDSLSDSEKQVNGKVMQDLTAAKKGLKDQEYVVQGLEDEWKKYGQAFNEAMAPESVEELNNQIKNLIKDEDFIGKGKKITESLQQGLMEGTYAMPETVDQLNELVKFDKAQQKAQKFGIEVPEWIAAGMASGEITVNEATDRMNQLIKFDKAQAKAKEAGYNIPSELSSQISNGEISVDDAVKRLNNLADFNKMVEAANDAGIDVPKDLGRRVAAGEKSATEEVKKLNSQASKAIKKDTGAGTSGDKVGKDFSGGVKKGVGPTKTNAQAMNTAVKTELDKAKGPAKTSGENTGLGFASGTIGGSVMSTLRSAGAKIVSGFLGAIKKKAEQKSPSRLIAREGGKPATQGFALGAVQAIPAVKSAGEQVVLGFTSTVSSSKSITEMVSAGMILSNKTITSVVKTMTKKKNYLKKAGRDVEKAFASGISGKYAEKSIKELNKMLDKETDKTKKKQIKNAIDLKKNNKKAIADVKKQYKKLYSDYKKDLNKLKSDNKSALQKLKEDYQKNLQSIEDNYKSTLANIKSQQDSLSNSLSGIDRLFSGDTVLSKSRILEDSKKQLDGLKRFDSAIARLIDRNLPNEMIEQFRELGPEYSLQLEELNKLNDEEIQEYIQYYNERKALGDRMASEQYADERAQAAAERELARKEALDDYNKAVEEQNEAYQTQYKKLVKQLNKDSKALGKAIKSGLKKGTKLSKKERNEIADNLTKSVLKQIKKQLGIKSPSKVVEKEVGRPMGQAIPVGFITAVESSVGRMQKSLNKSIGGLDVRKAMSNINTSNVAGTLTSAFDELTDVVKSSDGVIKESAKSIASSFDLMTQSVDEFKTSEDNLNLGYSGINNNRNNGVDFGKINVTTGKGEQIANGDVYNFYTNEKVSPVEYAREIKKQKRLRDLGIG